MLCRQQPLVELMKTLATNHAPLTVTLGLVLAISTLLATCQDPLRVHNWDSVSVVLERTACFGSCPVYTVKIHGNGQVEYSGKVDVDTIGSRTARIEPDKVRNLVQDFDAVHFLGLHDKYSERCTDMPTAIISISFDGKTKRVSNYFGGCESKTSGPQIDLDRLAKEIDDAAGTLRWTKCGFDCDKESTNKPDSSR
jgi:uncharacterized protein DUF6438